MWVIKLADNGLGVILLAKEARFPAVTIGIACKKPAKFNC